MKLRHEKSATAALRKGMPVKDSVAAGPIPTLEEGDWYTYLELSKLFTIDAKEVKKKVEDEFLKQCLRQT